MASTVSSPLMKRLAKAEERIKTKDIGDLQRRIDDFATRYQESEVDDLLSQYPSELFEPTPEILREKPVEATLEAEAGK